MVGGRHWGVAALLVAAFSLWMPAAEAEDRGPWGETVEDAGVRVNLYASDLTEIRNKWQQAQLRDEGPWFTYAATSVCGARLPGSGSDDDLCRRSFLPCSAENPEIGPGPAMHVHRREVDRDNAPVVGSAGNWALIGTTCSPSLVPGVGPQLTLAMIRDAFHDTDFTVPTVNIQPEGDLTLVNLPTFFEAKFPESGFGPGEIDAVDPARMLGHRVEVRPVLKSITYHLGGQTVGPTTSMGGPYPNGDVRATYSSAGSHEVRADIVYTGQFRVGGSEWFDIPGEVDLTGTPVTLTVAEAKSRLVTY